MSTEYTSTCIPNFIRRRVRRVNEDGQVEKAKELAAKEGKVIICVNHGGSVANAYKYPAKTEGVVTVAWPDGSVWQDMALLPANKVTLSGVFATITGFRGLFDNRFSAEKKKSVRTQFLLAIQSCHRC